MTDYTKIIDLKSYFVKRKQQQREFQSSNLHDSNLESCDEKYTKNSLINVREDLLDITKLLQNHFDTSSF